MSTPEVRYHQENLLDKFINNEKRSKLWAIVSVIAFCAVGATIISVAYNIKKAPVITTLIPPTTKIDTVYITKTIEPGNTINPLDQTVKEQQVEINRLKDLISTTSVQSTQQIQQITELKQLLEECKSKPTTPTATTPTITNPVVIYVYTLGGTADSTINKIRYSLEGKKRSGIKLIFANNRSETAPTINYVDPQYQDLANNIANFFNNKTRFRMQYGITVSQVKGTMSEGASIEIFLRYIN